MAQIRQYTAQQQSGGGAAGARSTAVAPVVDLRGPIQAAGDFTRATMDLARHQERMSEKLAQDEAALYATNTMSQAGAMWQERIAKAQTDAPAGASGFTDGLLKDFDKWSEQTKRAAPERAKNLLAADMARFRQGLHAEAFRFEIQSRNAKLIDDNEIGIDSDARMMTVAPGQLTDTLARRLAAIDALEIPASIKAKLAGKAREQTSYFAGLTLANADPGQWLQRDATKDPVKSLMAPEKVASLDAHAHALIRQAQSHALAGQKEAIRAAEKALEDLQDFVLSGNTVSPQYEQSVMAQLGAMPGMTDAGNTLIKLSRDGAGFGALPLPEQQRRLETFLPGDPQQAKVKALLQSVNNRQQAAYKEDPWSAAAQFGRVPLSPTTKLAVAEQIPALIDERLKSQHRVEVLAGEPVSPLRPAEVADATRLIQAMQPQQQGEIVGAIGAKLSVPQIAKLTEQLDKSDRVLALQMMAGADRTSAGVALATRIRQGATAIKDKVVKKDDQALSGWRSEIAKYIGDALPNESERQAAIDAAFYVRAAMEVEGYAFNASNEQAAALVVGHVYDKQGTKTTIPRGMTVADFEKKLSEYTPERLSAIAPKFYVRGKEVPPSFVAARLSDMALRRTSAGAYVPFNNAAAVTLDAAGTQPLVIEVR